MIKMELFLYLIPNTSRHKSKGYPKKEDVPAPKEVRIGENVIWIWKLPFAKEELEEIQKNFWKRRFFLFWMKQNLKGKFPNQVLQQMKENMLKEQFQQYYQTEERLRILYVLYYLREQYAWKKETKWFVFCGSILDKTELLEFLSYFLEEANCIFLYGTQLSEVELDGLWEESGLLVTKTRELEALKECDLILDAAPKLALPKKWMPQKGIYLDLTEDAEKRRVLRAKFGKIHYISLQGYLDRVFQSTV